jgi:hypothetical protein
MEAKRVLAPQKNQLTLYLVANCFIPWIVLKATTTASPFRAGSGNYIWEGHILRRFFYRYV